MVIRNKTKNIILSNNAVLATSFKQKAFGLLLAKKGTAMIFRTRFGIHTFFMKYPIDVLVLDSKNNIAAIKENIQPNRIFVWKPIHTQVIELPAGVIKQTQTQQKNTVLILNN